MTDREALAALVRAVEEHCRAGALGSLIALYKAMDDAVRLLERPPAVPHNRTPTSREAAVSIAPVAGTLRHRVWTALRRRPASNEELAASLDMRLQTVCGRVAELRAQGLVEDSGDRARTTSGRRAIVWQATR